MQIDAKMEDTPHLPDDAKRKELEVFAALKEAGVDFEYQKQIPLAGGASNDYATLDFLIRKPWGVIVLEIDEFQHRLPAYAHCDLRRDFTVLSSSSLGKQVVLRYNPDAFTVDGQMATVEKPARLKALVELICAWDNNPAPDLLFARFFLFYDQTAESELPCVADEWPNDMVRRMTRVVRVP
jgi:hypothetical protein